ncbi:hypothetical protein ABHV46_05865 [Asaia sp. BMEF1]|uniref:hypothetical protein n=1 Tax=Asaia sp. BMEF1 TaxID=3155932 RepID=UPI003F66B26A
MSENRRQTPSSAIGAGSDNAVYTSRVLIAVGPLAREMSSNACQCHANHRGCVIVTGPAGLAFGRSVLHCKDLIA